MQALDQRNVRFCPICVRRGLTRPDIDTPPRNTSGRGDKLGCQHTTATFHGHFLQRINIIRVSPECRSESAVKYLMQPNNSACAISRRRSAESTPPYLCDNARYLIVFVIIGMLQHNACYTTQTGAGCAIQNLRQPCVRQLCRRTAHTASPYTPPSPALYHMPRMFPLTFLRY